MTVHEASWQAPDTAYAVTGAGWASPSCFFQPREASGAREGLEGSSAFTGESWLQRIVFFLSSFGFFLQLLF